MHMPRMDGYALTREIRAREAAVGAVRTPIVAVTANAMRGEEERCLESGMDAYLAKPVAIARLSATLGRWIALTPPVDPPAGVVDRPMLRSWLGDDEATLRSLLAEFLNTARQNEREIEAALGSDEITAAVMPSHNLRGGALAVGAHALAQAAGAMEAAARISDGARCRDLLAPLARELQRAADDIGG